VEYAVTEKEPEVLDGTTEGAQAIDDARDEKAEAYMAHVMAGGAVAMTPIEDEPVVEFTPINVNDDIRTDRPLHEFFTRREPYWQARDRTKYPPHTGMQQRIRQEWPGMSRSQVRDAVRNYLAEQKAKETTDGEG
jgi:hypothetical protein